MRDALPQGRSTTKAQSHGADPRPLVHHVGKRKPWSGILLYGPPGTGKSYLAKVGRGPELRFVVGRCGRAGIRFQRHCVGGQPLARRAMTAGRRWFDIC